MIAFRCWAGFVLLAICNAQKTLDIHSFDKDIEYPVYQARWFNAGTAIPLEHHIALSPSVPDRFGAQWHKYPLLTDDFEVTFKVVTKGPADGAPPRNDQGFAFWYVYENVTAVIPDDFTHDAKDVHARMSANGWGLFGYRNKFRGMGLFFSNTRKGANSESTELKPSVSVLVNDGSRSVLLPNDLPTQHGSYWNFRNNALLMRVRVQKTGVLVEGKVEGTANWIKLAELSAGHMPMPLTSGGYIGFTGYVAPDKPGSVPSKFGQNDAVHIENLVFVNMDPTQKGEDEVEVPKANTEPHGKASEFLHEKSEEGLERAEGRAIKTLSRMIFKMISETEPLKKSISSAIATLTKRLSAMEKSVLKLKEEIVSLSGHDMDGDYAKMKAELAQLSSKALSDVATKKQHLESLKSEIETSLDSSSDTRRASSSQVVKTLHEVDIKARDLKKQVASRGSFTLYVALFCLALVVIAGIALQSKLRNWEKKHLL